MQQDLPDGHQVALLGGLAFGIPTVLPIAAHNSDAVVTPSQGRKRAFWDCTAIEYGQLQLTGINISPCSVDLSIRISPRDQAQV